MTPVKASPGLRIVVETDADFICRAVVVLVLVLVPPLWTIVVPRLTAVPPPLELLFPDNVDGEKIRNCGIELPR